MNNEAFVILYAAALSGVCSNPQLAAHAIQAEQQAKNIIGSEVNVPLTLAKQAHAIATAAMQQLDNEGKDGF